MREAAHDGNALLVAGQEGRVHRGTGFHHVLSTSIASAPPLDYEVVIGRRRRDARITTWCPNHDLAGAAG